MSDVGIYFKLAELIFVASASLGAAFPDACIALLGSDASTDGRLWGRAFGAAAAGAAVAFAITGLADANSVVSGDLPPYGWASSRSMR